jgi:hypothetical protein
MAVTALAAIACGGQTLDTGSADSGGATDAIARDSTGDRSVKDAVGDGATEDVAVEDASDGEPSDHCPSGASFVASTTSPQWIALDEDNVYWATAPYALSDGGSGTRVFTPTGAVQSIPRKGGTVTPTNRISGLTGAIVITRYGDYLAYSAVGPSETSTDGMVGFERIGSKPVSLATSQVLPFGVAINDVEVFWVSDTGGDGVAVEATGLGGGSSLVLGTVAGANNRPGGASATLDSVYFAVWTYPSGSGGGIFTVPIAGGMLATLQSFDSGAPNDLRIDDNNVYWDDVGSSASGSGAVFSMPLAGGSVTTLASGLGTPDQLAVDAKNVYTADFTTGLVYEMPIGSSGPPKILVAAASTPVGVAADEYDDFVYFSLLASGSICKVSK